LLQTGRQTQFYSVKKSLGVNSDSGGIWNNHTKDLAQLAMAFKATGCALSGVPQACRMKKPPPSAGFSRRSFSSRWRRRAASSALVLARRVGGEGRGGGHWEWY